MNLRKSVKDVGRNIYAQVVAPLKNFPYLVKLNNLCLRRIVELKKYYLNFI